jgi:putative DNA primase/helicase
MSDLALERFLDSVDFDGRLACDGTVQRYGRKGNKWIWSLAKGDNTFVVAGDWSTGEKVHFGRMTHVLQRAVRQLRNDRDEKAQEAAEAARKTWEGLDEKPTGRTYLERKGVAGFGLRYRKQLVFVPMVRDCEIVGLQSIDPLGNKRFTRGCAKRGAYHIVRGSMTRPPVLCEGYATGASIRMATGLEVIVAFDCGNLMPVARQQLGIGIVAADNDLTEGNPGLNAAQQAALACGAVVRVPPAGMDFNDVHAERGLDEVARYFADIA